MQGGKDRGQDRLTLWQVPEVYNLLRHLNIKKNLSWKGNCTPNMPLGGRASPWEIRRLWALPGQGRPLP